MSETTAKSGFVTIVGRPNVGKSTLLNAILGHKVAITSDKPQTTRNRIHGVYTDERGQIVFIDTPGIHKPKSRLGDYMVKVARETLQEVDVICWMIDVEEKLGPGDRFISKLLAQVTTPVFLLMNKIDRVHPEQLLPLIDQYRQLLAFKEVIPVSALKGNNIPTLIEQLYIRLPHGPKYYPEDQITDHPEQFIVSERIREKILHLTREEVPHSIAVVIEDMERRDDSRGTVYIRATILTERPSQKGILIGKRGQMLKEIGKQARADVEKLFGSPIFLDLWVKVKRDWRNEEAMLKQLGYRDE